MGRRRVVQLAGILLTLVYGSGVVWLYATQPQSLADVGNQARVAAGTYQVDEAHRAAALGMFRRDQFSAAREEFNRADPAQRDAVVQFYVAYSFYRQGWGRLQNDDALFKQGLEAVKRAIALSPTPLQVPDPDLKMQTAAELQSELEAGLVRSLSDFNPMRVVQERK